MAPPNKTLAPPPLPQVGKPAQRADARRNREAVLGAARQLFKEGGCDCPIEGIAKQAGVGVGTVYRHFPNKDALVDALVDQRFEHLTVKAREALEKEDAWEAFVELMRYSANYQAEDRGLSELMSQRPARGRESAIKTGLSETTEKLIHKAQRQGTMRKDVVIEDVPTILCGLGGVLGAHEESMPALNWERFLTLLLDGMRAPGNPATKKLPKPKRTIAG
jgi:AcrR family transcriptional regulator